MNRAMFAVANLELNWQCDVAEDLGLAAAGRNDMRDITANGNHGRFGSLQTPEFLVGPPMDGSRYRVTLGITAVPGCADTVGVNVLANGSITRVSDGAVFVLPYTTSPTYTFVPAAVVTRPGAGDDLALSVLVDGTADACIGAGDQMTVSLSSPLGGMNWWIPFFVIQFYAPGTWPGSSFPGVQMNFAAASPPILVLDGSTALAGLGALLLPPGGITFGAVFPPGLSGLTMNVQFVAVGPAALNGLYATTTATEMYVL